MTAYCDFTMRWRQEVDLGWEMETITRERGRRRWVTLVIQGVFY